MASPLGPPPPPRASASAAPPTPQEIERKLGSPSLPPTTTTTAASPSLAALSTSLETPGFALLERRGSLASRRTSMISSTADDESDAHDPTTSSSSASHAAFASSGGAPLRTSPPSFLAPTTSTTSTTSTSTATTATASSSSHPQQHPHAQHHLALQSISETDDALGEGDGDGGCASDESDASSLGGGGLERRREGAFAVGPGPAQGHGQGQGRARAFDLAPVRTGSGADGASGASGARGGGGGGRGGLSDNVALKSGYLMKKGERRKAWKKRWFVLRGGQLAMYKSDKEYRLLRLIPLSDIHAVAPISLKKHAHAFGIVTPRRTYYVHADSSPEAHAWCRALDAARSDEASRATVNSVETPTPTPTPRGGASPAGTPRGGSFEGARAGAGFGGAAGAAAGTAARGTAARAQQEEDDDEREGEEDEPSEGEYLAHGHGLGLDDGGSTTPRALAEHGVEYTPSGPSSSSSAAVNIPGSTTTSAPAFGNPHAPGSSYASTGASSSYSATGAGGVGPGVRAPPNSAANAPGGSFPPQATTAAAAAGAGEDWSAGLDARLSQLDLGGPGPGPGPSASSSALAPAAPAAPTLHSPLSPPIPMPSATTSSSLSTAPSSTTTAAPRPPTARRPSARSDTLASVPELPFAHALAGTSAPPLGSAPGRTRDRSGSSATRLSVSPCVAGGGVGASGLSAVSSSEEDEPLYVEAQRVVPGTAAAQGQGALGAPFVAAPAQQQQVQQVQQPAPPQQVDDPNKVILSGYLTKQGKRKNWRKRWFVLQSGMLMYSKSHMDTKHARQIPLSSIVDAIEAPSHPHYPSSPSLSGPPSSPLSPPTSSSTSSPHDTAPTSSSSSGGPTPDNTFKIITPSRTFLVCAPSEEDEIKWLAALQCLVARRTAQALQPPPPPAAATPATAPAPAQQAPEVVRRPSQPQRPTAHGRQRSVTDAARQAVRDVERRFHPGSYSHGQPGAAAA